MTEQPALRDRIAALFRHPPGGERLGDATPGEIADAVLAVLPAGPEDTTTTRADVLREAADRFDRHAEQILVGVGDLAVFVAKARRDQVAVWREAAETLRRLAAETQPSEPEAEPDTVPEAEAERLATLTDCPNSRHGGLHCGHYQEGDGPCCNCQRPNWCPDGGIA